MKITWPLALVIVAALVAVVVTQLVGGTTNDILLIILTVLSAVNAAELREVKTNSNGNVQRQAEQNDRLVAQNAKLSRDLADVPQRALGQFSPSPQPMNIDPSEHVR